MESMESCVKTKLGQLGYHVHTKPYEYRKPTAGTGMS
mgnify:CR=1 FL=1